MSNSNFDRRQRGHSSPNDIAMSIFSFKANGSFVYKQLHKSMADPGGGSWGSGPIPYPILVDPLIA